MRVDLIQPATGSPVTVDEAKAWAKCTHDAEDALWPGWIGQAVSLAQEWSGRQFLDAEFRLVSPRFPRDGQFLELWPAPLRDVVEVRYLDRAGVDQVLASDAFSILAPKGPYAEGGRLWATAWPQTATHPEAVRVAFHAGYGATPDDVPEGLRQAVLAGAAEAYARRESARVLDAMLSLLEPFRLGALPTRIGLEAER